MTLENTDRGVMLQLSPWACDRDEDGGHSEIRDGPRRDPRLGLRQEDNLPCWAASSASPSVSGCKTRPGQLPFPAASCPPNLRSPEPTASGSC